MTHPETDPIAPVLPFLTWTYRVGEFVSSARRPALVLCLAVGEAKIKEYGAHPDFRRWLPPTGNDEALLEEIDNRDKNAEWADKLAQAIADRLGVDIGEHSSNNLPWLRALDAIRDAP